jgi:tRNA(Arg) A34 adenosine deaminase TadA
LKLHEMENSFMARAISLALDNIKAARGGPFATVIVKGGEIIAEGANQVTLCNDPTAHAEIVAIRKACHKLKDFRLTGCDVYTTSEPCPMCLGALYWSRADRVFFAGRREDAAAAGFDDAFLYQELRLPLKERKLPMIPLMRAEASRVFQAWNESSNRVPY